MRCPKCNGEMWDNSKNKRNLKGPDFKCKDVNCKWKMNKEGMWEPSEFTTAVWLEKPKVKGSIKPLVREEKPVDDEITEIAKHDLNAFPDAEIADDDTDMWLTYRQRVQEIKDIFADCKDPCDTSRAGAILGLRELMFNGKPKKF